MKNKHLLFSLLAFLMFCNVMVHAQCSAGLSQVTVVVETDDYGYEGYWEIVPSGNACGVGALQFGGNAVQVGCTGGGVPYTATPGNGYANNTTVSALPICLPTGNVYQLKYIDDYGDGGFEFTVKIDGFPIYTFNGSGSSHTFNFTITPPPAFDLGVTKILMPMYGQPGNKSISGKIFNYGSTTINSFDLNYSINGSSPITQTISGFSMPGFTSYSFAHPVLWIIGANGTYSIDVWATNLNGTNLDTNLTNDHKLYTTVIGDPTPNFIDDYTHSNFTFTTIASSVNGILAPRDLDFHPVLSRNELWVVLKSTEQLGGKTAKISNAGNVGQSVLIQQDGNALHFMSLPTGIAFSDNGNFSTSPGVLDANHGTGHFTGPTLWSSDPAIYAMPSGGNGSHLDMLHQCPYAMGVTWETDNVFWVFDGYNSDLMRCDFGEDHGPGNSDHSDGKIRAYEDITFSYSNLDVPCHMALDSNKQWLYIVNGDDSKIYRMDINSGSQSGIFTPYGEVLAEHSIYTGTNNSIYVSTGLVLPSGIDVVGNRMVVCDFTTGDIVLYDISGPNGIEIGRILTGTPGIQGVKIGPDGKIWYVNRTTNLVKRIDYTLWAAGINEAENEISSVVAYPNPSSDLWHIRGNSTDDSVSSTLFNMLGEIVDTPLSIANGNKFEIKVYNENLAKGIYLLKLKSKNSSKTIRLMKL